MGWMGHMNAPVLIKGFPLHRPIFDMRNVVIQEDALI